jgi:chromosome segregation ATPase
LKSWCWPARQYDENNVGNQRYGLMQLEKHHEELRAQDRELWREIGALQAARNFHATQIAAIEEELHTLEPRVTAKIEESEERMSAKVEDVVETIRFEIRTMVALSGVLIALAQLVFFWLR